MKLEDLSQCELPKKRTGAVVRWIADTSICEILLWGLIAYIVPVVVVSGIESLAPCSAETAWVKAGAVGETGFWNLVYFNFITMLTVGYGDYAPHGYGARFLSVAEALWGTGVLTVSLSALIAKFLSPPKKAIVFSRYAYYCIDEERFMVVYLNTTQKRIVNADQSAYFKLKRDWRVTPPVRSPLITQSVQTFYTVGVSKDDIVAELNIDDLNDPTDRLRFGISGLIGSASFSVAIEYGPGEIVVIPNRSDLTAYEGFWGVQEDARKWLSDDNFRRMFHFRPDGASTLVEYVKTNRQETK
jgi:hypothetical protein